MKEILFISGVLRFFISFCDPRVKFFRLTFSPLNFLVGSLLNCNLIQTEHCMFWRLKVLL